MTTPGVKGEWASPDERGDYCIDSGNRFQPEDELGRILSLHDEKRKNWMLDFCRPEQRLIVPDREVDIAPLRIKRASGSRR